MNTDENQETPGGSAHLGHSDRPCLRKGIEKDRLVGVNGENKFKESLSKLGVS